MTNTNILEVKKWNYGEYSSDNYGVNTLCFEEGPNKFWFSYETLVAFKISGEFHIIKNYWGTTTGKHLNWIDGGDKKSRLTPEEFNAKLQEFLR